jgi:hypothetical protein
MVGQFKRHGFANARRCSGYQNGLAHYFHPIGWYPFSRRHSSAKWRWTGSGFPDLKTPRAKADKLNHEFCQSGSFLVCRRQGRINSCSGFLTISTGQGASRTTFKSITSYALFRSWHLNS